MITSLLITLTASQGLSQSITKELLHLLKSTQILMLGETHKHPQSTSLLYDIADQYTSTGECIAVALEITSDQQEVLTQVLKGSLPSSHAVEIGGAGKGRQMHQYACCRCSWWLHIYDEFVDARSPNLLFLDLLIQLH